MAWRVVEWFWVAKCNHNCWNTVAESFLKASYLTCAYSAAKCLHFLCVVWAWSCCRLRTVTNTGWRLNNRNVTVRLLLLISSSVSFGLIACALSSLLWLPSVKSPTKRMPWRFALDHVNYEMSNFQLAQLLLPWSNCVETKIEERRGDLCGLHSPSSGILLWTDSLYLQTSVQLAVLSPVRMRLGRVSWLERGSSANEVTVFNTVYNQIPNTVYIICQFEALKKLTDLINYVDKIMPI